MKLSQKINFFLSKKYASLAILLTFALIYGLITFINHYTFRTSSDPTAIYTNAMYDYVHGRANDCTLLTPINAELDKPFFDNKFSDHFNVILVIFSPLQYIFGSYTLFVVQWLFILLGGWGVRRYFLSRTDKLTFANLAMFHFFSIWAIFSALGFDYHDNVLAAMLLPWLMWAYDNKKWKWVIITALVMLLCKENVSLWVFFVFLSLFLFNLKDSSKRTAGWVGALVSVGYFLVVTKLIMPGLANEGRGYLHFHYAALGDNYGDAIKFILLHPLDTIKILFTNHTNNPYGNGVKLELHYVMLLSGSFAFFLRPKYLLMALPILGMKLFSDHLLKWGLNYHYCIEFTPLLTLALFSWLADLSKRNNQKAILIGFACCLATVLITTIKNNTRTAKWFDKPRHNILDSKHYTREFEIGEVYEALKLIPDNEDIAISGHFQVLPHLPFRKDIYEFPVVASAEYIILFDLEKYTYPLNKESYKEEIEKYRASNAWDILYDKNKTLVLKRNGNAKDYDEYPYWEPIAE